MSEWTAGEIEGRLHQIGQETAEVAAMLTAHQLTTLGCGLGSGRVQGICSCGDSSPKVFDVDDVAGWHDVHIESVTVLPLPLDV